MKVSALQKKVNFQIISNLPLKVITRSHLTLIDLSFCGDYWISKENRSKFKLNQSVAYSQSLHVSLQ